MRKLPLQGRGSSSQLPQPLILLQAPPIVDTVDHLCQRSSRHFGGKHDTAQSGLNMHLTGGYQIGQLNVDIYTAKYLASIISSLKSSHDGVYSYHAHC